MQMTYNTLNKGAVDQCTPGRRQNVAKIVPYFTRAGALFFVSENRYNKGYNSTEHDYECEQIRICNHKHQPPFFCQAAGIVPQRLPG